jgi:ketosteroid isomerase-like protein
MRYDGVEIQVCVEYDDHDGETHIEPVVDEEAAREEVESGEGLRWFYTVYWKVSDGTVEAVADFVDKEKAEYLARIMELGLMVSKE